jgi:hypothetical protein
VESRGYDCAVAESPHLTAEQARAALDEAGARAAQVRRSDLQLSWILLAIAAAYVGVGVVLSVSPHHGSTVAGVAVLAMLAAAIGGSVVIWLRIRAYSRGGLIWYFATMIAFNLWNAAAASVSIGTRFWASSQPSYHFGITVAVAIIPLLVGAIALARRA